MIGTLFFSIIAIFFAWLEDNKTNRHGLKFSLFTIFLFLALRYNFGNDYMHYLDMFYQINRFENINALSVTIKGNEFGWFYLNRIFKPLGFFAMTAVLAAFNCYVIYRFIKKYVPAKYYWFAVFLYTFQVSQMLVLSSAMRQAVAVSFFILAIDYIIQKKPFKYIILIFIATLFHTSAAVLFPLIIISYINWKIKFVHIILVFVVFLIPIYFLPDITAYVNVFVSQYFDTYTYYLENASGTSISEIGLGFILNISIYFVIVYNSQFEIDLEKNIFLKIAIISFILIPLGFSLQLIGRINFYFMPVLLIVFPLIFSKMKKTYKMIYIGIVVLFTFYNFYLFFNEGVYKIPFKTYQTIFSAPNWY